MLGVLAVEAVEEGISEPLVGGDEVGDREFVEDGLGRAGDNCLPRGEVVGEQLTNRAVAYCNSVAESVEPLDDHVGHEGGLERRDG